MKAAVVTVSDGVSEGTREDKSGDLLSALTYLNAGPVQTFPIFVWGVARVALPPHVNVVASAIFLVAIGLGLADVVWQYRAAKSTRGGT